MGDCEDNEEVMRRLFEYDALMQAEERERGKKINIPEDIMIKVMEEVCRENGIERQNDSGRVDGKIPISISKSL